MRDLYVYTLAVLTGLLSVGPLMATYVSFNKQDGPSLDSFHKKSNPSVSQKRSGSQFKTDKDIQHYLKLYGLEMMIWRCRNAIQPRWDWKPLPVVDKVKHRRNSSFELYCEAIGRLKSVKWYHNGKEMSVGGRFGQLIVPHYANGRYYANWIDFKLKIYNATYRDSGIYTFRALSPNGQTAEQVIYVDISEKKTKKKRRRKLERERKRRLNHRRKFLIKSTREKKRRKTDANNKIAGV